MSESTPLDRGWLIAHSMRIANQSISEKTLIDKRKCDRYAVSMINQEPHTYYVVSTESAADFYLERETLVEADNVVEVRQYMRENHPTYTDHEITRLED